MKRIFRTVSFLVLGSLLAMLAFSVTTPAAPALAASAHIRVNQVGYVTGEPKRALLMASGSESGATFTVKNSSGATVFGPVAIGASLGSWSTGFPNVYLLDLSALQTPGTYTIAVSGPIAATSPKFKIDTAAALYTPLMQNALFYFQAQRDGPNVISSVMSCKPSHLNDRSASIYDHPAYNGDGVLQRDLTRLGGPIDASGGWFDAGDYVKFLNNGTYANLALLFASREYPTAYGSGGTADLTAEAKFGVDWLHKMWNDSTKTLYYQVGIGDGNGGSIAGDHDIWRLPEADDTWGGSDATYKYIRNRPVLRAGPAGSRISPNLAGRLTASFALCYQIYRLSDPTYANKCLLSAQHVFDLANTTPGTLLTAAPAAYYPEDDWESDLELGAVELYLAMADGQAAGTLPSGLPRPDPAYYLGQAAHWAKMYIQNRTGTGTFNLYDVSALSHYDLHRAITRAGNPGGLEVTKTDLVNSLKAQLDKGVSKANTDPFGLGFGYGTFNSSSHTLGFAATAYFYKKLTNATTYDKFARDQRDFMFGRNAWGASFIVGAGTTFPFCTHHQIANISGTLNGASPILKGSVVNGPNDTTLFSDLGG